MRGIHENTGDFAKRREMGLDRLKDRCHGRLMVSGSLPEGAQLSPSLRSVHATLSKYFEYAYYAAVSYGYLGTAYGLSISMLTAGMIALLGGLCILRLRAQAIVALRFPILFAVSFIFIQIAVHGESFMQSYVRAMVIYMLTAIIIVALSNRPGFIPRFAAIMFLIGLMALPFMDFSKGGRAAVDEQVGVLQNPNGLAEFFGFIAVAFTIRGLESRRSLACWLHIAITIFSLFILGLTVTRSVIIAYCLALIIVFRRQLRRSFIPILILVALGGGAFASGLFDSIIGSYSERAMEDTGRTFLWASASALFVESPMAGIGVSKSYIELPLSKKSEGPHNGFLFVALSSGVIPLLLFAAYWLMGLRGALKTSSQNPMQPYLLPLWAYAFFQGQFNSEAFFQPWSIFSVCICLVQLIPNLANWRLRHKAGVMPNLQRGGTPAVSKLLWIRK
jgi:O-antigen ligase